MIAEYVQAIFIKNNLNTVREPTTLMIIYRLTIIETARRVNRYVANYFRLQNR